MNLFEQWERIYDECGSSVGEDGQASGLWYDCSHRILFPELYPTKDEQEQEQEQERSTEQAAVAEKKKDTTETEQEHATKEAQEEEENKIAAAQRASEVEAFLVKKGALGADEVKGASINRFQRLLVACPVDAVQACIQEQQKQEEEEARSGRKRGFKSIEDELITKQLEFACVMPLYDWSRCTARALAETRVLEELDSCVRMHNVDDRETVLKVFCGKELVAATALWAKLGHQVAMTMAEVAEDEYSQRPPTQRQMTLICGSFLQHALRSYLASKAA